jgi:hypothetical protein
MCVEQGPYAVSMANKCKMTIKHPVLNMCGSSTGTALREKSEVKKNPKLLYNS